MGLCREISAMEPCGISNPVPTFVLREARVLRIIPMSGGKHTRLVVEKDGIEMSAVRFGVGAQELGCEVGDAVDLLFQINVNEFRGVSSLQMILQDLHLAERFEQLYKTQMHRYEQIKAGDEYTEEEGILPDRDDVAVVYTVLKREYRAGHTTFGVRRLLSLLESVGHGEIGYAKLKFILRIMQELQICGVNEFECDTYTFEFYYQTAKTNIEKSSILRKLRLQMRRG